MSDRFDCTALAYQRDRATGAEREKLSEALTYQLRRGGYLAAEYAAKLSLPARAVAVLSGAAAPLPAMPTPAAPAASHASGRPLSYAAQAVAFGDAQRIDDVTRLQAARRTGDASVLAAEEARIGLGVSSAAYEATAWKQATRRAAERLETPAAVQRHGTFGVSALSDASVRQRLAARSASGPRTVQEATAGKADQSQLGGVHRKATATGYTQNVEDRTTTIIDHTKTEAQGTPAYSVKDALEARALRSLRADRRAVR